MSFNLTKASLSPDYSNTLKESDFNYRQAAVSIKGKYNRLEYPRIGYSIPKRGTKLAFRRNRLKRLVKEAFRLNAHQLPMMDLIVLVQNESQDEVLSATLDAGFSKLIQLKHDK